jgi:hypothetical protein
MILQFYLFLNSTINCKTHVLHTIHVLNYFYFILDNLSLMYNEKKVPLLRTQIAWDSDKNIKYQNPEHPRGNLKEGLLYLT